jgi:hypothetical protein
MIQFFKNLFTSKPTVEFKCIEGAFNIGSPIREARKVIPYWMKPQIVKKDVKFAKCPGMFDQAQAGYIISAHVDIHIKANRQAVLVMVDNIPPGFESSKMDYDLVAGMAPIKDNVQKNVRKVPLPWAIFCKPGYSTTVMAATMHSPFLDKLYIYPGIVDHDSFHTINLIFSVTEECEFTIYAGTPLLQVIPFKRETITAEYGKGSVEDKDKHRFTFISRMPGLYRKIFQHRKHYKLKSV